MNLISRTKVFHVSNIPSREAFDAHTDAIADALFDLQESITSLVDSAVGVDLANGIVEITVTVEHAGLEEGKTVADSCIRTAVHTAGGATQQWDDSFETTKESAELVCA